VATATGQNTGRNTGRQKGWANIRPPWPKGVSGNPGGRPKRDLAAEVAEAVFAENPKKIYDGMLKALSEGNSKAFTALADRAFGKLKEQVEMAQHLDFLVGRTTEEKEFFAVNGYWPNPRPGPDEPEPEDPEEEQLGSFDKRH